MNNAFWKKVKKTETCWIWTGCLVAGYGQIQINKKRHYSHRLTYEEFKGRIPKGFEIDHLCRVPKCVNPEHLEAVSPRENKIRGISFVARNSKKTHCNLGHEFTKENTYLRDGGKRRECRLCKKRWS